MAHDQARAVPQPVLHATADDVALPVPRPPVLEAPAPDIARPAPRPPVPERTPHDIATPARQAARGPHVGWLLISVVAAGAAWGIGWLAGVSWAWRELTPRFLSRPNRRRGAGLPGA